MNLKVENNKLVFSELRSTSQIKQAERRTFDMKNYKVWPQVLIAIAANGGSILYGLSLGWSSTSGPQILSSNHAFKMTENEFSWAVSMMPLGGALSGVISGIIRNRFGTKATMLVFAIPNLLGWLALIFAWNPLMIIAGRLLIGIAGGAYCFNIPVFIGEIASKEIRGILLTLFQVFVKFGVVLVYMLGSLVNLFVLNVVCGSLLMVYVVCFMFLPETPVYLIRKNEIEKARKAIKTLRGSFYDAQQEISEYQQFVDEASKASKSSFFEEIQKRETMKAFLIIVCLFFFFQMSGINAVIFYTFSIFEAAGVTMDPSLATIILGVVQLIATLATAAFVDRFGRVFLLIASFVMMIVGLIGIGAFFHMKNLNVQSSTEYDWLPLPFLCIFVIGFSSGMGSVPFVLLGEIFSDEAKKIIAPFTQTMNFTMSFMVGLYYSSIVSSIGIGSTFFMFAGFCFAGLLFTIFAIPETKGKSLAEIQTLLRS